MRAPALLALLLPALAACAPAPAAQPDPADRRQILSEVTGASDLVEDGRLRLTVEAVAATPGWSDLALEPVVYVQAPPDGIYDATLYGLPPEGMVAQVLTPVRVIVESPVEALPRAWRIHAQSGCLVVLLTMPEPAPDIRDCPVVRIPGLSITP